MAFNQVIRWPAWYYGPGGSSAIFNSLEEVPEGWFCYDDRDKVVEPGAPPLPDSPDSWAGHSKASLIMALRKAGHKIHANYSPRKLFELAVETGSIPGYGKPSE